MWSREEYEEMRKQREAEDLLHRLVLEERRKFVDGPIVDDGIDPSAFGALLPERSAAGALLPERSAAGALLPERSYAGAFLPINHAAHAREPKTTTRGIPTSPPRVDGWSPRTSPFNFPGDARASRHDGMVRERDELYRRARIASRPIAAAALQMKAEGAFDNEDVASGVGPRASGSGMTRDELMTKLGRQNNKSSMTREQLDQRMMYQPAIADLRDRLDAQKKLDERTKMKERFMGVGESMQNFAEFIGAAASQPLVQNQAMQAANQSRTRRSGQAAEERVAADALAAKAAENALDRENRLLAAQITASGKAAANPHAPNLTPKVRANRVANLTEIMNHPFWERTPKVGDTEGDWAATDSQDRVGAIINGIRRKISSQSADKNSVKDMMMGVRAQLQTLVEQLQSGYYPDSTRMGEIDRRINSLLKLSPAPIGFSTT